MSMVPHPLTAYAGFDKVGAMPKLPPELREYFSKIGKKGAAKGGKTRAVNLTPEERSESARKAAQARWARAKRKGSE